MKIKLNGKRLYPTDLVIYCRVKTDSKLNWKSHVNAIATELDRANALLYKVRDFVNANILKSIYYALFGDKLLVQLTVSTFSKKSHLELSILKSVMLTPLLCFITLKLLTLQIKSRLRTVSLQTNIPIINYVQFLLIGLHFHQCLTITKRRLPLKEIFKSLVSKQHHMEKMFLSIRL